MEPKGDQLQGTCSVSKFIPLEHAAFGGSPNGKPSRASGSGSFLSTTVLSPPIRKQCLSCLSVYLD